MRPFRLFIILVFLTASALAMVHLRFESARSAYRIQQLNARQNALRVRLWTQQKEIACYTVPQRLRELVDRMAVPVAPPVLGGGSAHGAGAGDWETD